MRSTKKRSEKAIVGKDTVQVFLTRWLDEDAARNREKIMRNGYEFDLEKYVFPHIGHMKLKD